MELYGLNSISFFVLVDCIAAEVEIDIVKTAAKIFSEDHNFYPGPVSMGEMVKINKLLRAVFTESERTEVNNMLARLAGGPLTNSHKIRAREDGTKALAAALAKFKERDDSN